MPTGAQASLLADLDRLSDAIVVDATRVATSSDQQAARSVGVEMAAFPPLNPSARGGFMEKLQQVMDQESVALAGLLAFERAQDQEWTDELRQAMNKCVSIHKQIDQDIAFFTQATTDSEGELDRIVTKVSELHSKYPEQFEDATSDDKYVPASDTPGLAEMSAMEEKGAMTPAIIGNGKSGLGSKDLGATPSQKTFTTDMLNMAPKDYLEKARRTLLGKCVVTKCFDLLCTCVITLNAVYIGALIEYDLNNIGKDAPVWKHICEFSFFAFYLIELTLKLLVFKLSFFTNPDWAWNIFDTLLVISAIYNIIMEYVADSDATAGLMWMRMLRLLKMAKLLRIVRVMRFFRELRLMMSLISKSFRSLFWAIIMLGLVLYLFSLAFLQGVTGYMSDKVKLKQEIPPDIKVDIELYWDSMQDCMVTLLMSITRGIDYRKASKSLEEVGQVYHILFLFFISFATFSICNVLTGIFVQSSFESSAEDRDAVAHEALGVSRARAAKLTEALGKWCTSKSKGLLSRRKLLEACAHDPIVSTVIDELEISEEQLEDMFDDIAKVESINGKVPVKELANAMMEIVGPVQAGDLFQLNCVAQHHQHALEHLMEYIEHQFDQLRRAIATKYKGAGRMIVPLKDRLHLVKKRPVRLFADEM
jgi:hypothetical protein